MTHRSPRAEQAQEVRCGLRRAREHAIPFFASPPVVRRIICTTDAIECLHTQLRRIIRTRGHFPSDDAALMLHRLAPCRTCADKVRSARDWKAAMIRFAVVYGERSTRATAWNPPRTQNSGRSGCDD